MVELELQPGIGLGPIKLGEERQQVRKALADFGLSLKVSRGKQDYFDGIQVEYTEDRCTFIGASWSKLYKVRFQGVDVFDIPAKDLFDRLARHDHSGDHKFDAYEYVFPNLLVTLWDADEQYDRIGEESRKVWAQVGLRKKAT